MIGIAKGLATTLSHLVRPAICERYPYVKRELPERSRSSFALTRGEDGTPSCRACMLCEKDCPAGAISVGVDKAAEGGKRTLTSFSIDLGLCMYCGLCVEGCTAGALVHTGHFEHSAVARGATILHLFGAGGPQ